jgi:hypothetical protein
MDGKIVRRYVNSVLSIVALGMFVIASASAKPRTSSVESSGSSVFSKAGHGVRVAGREAVHGVRFVGQKSERVGAGIVNVVRKDGP